jgi:hypothetical protein
MANNGNSHEAFPKQVKLSDGTEVTIRLLSPAKTFRSGLKPV